MKSLFYVAMTAIAAVITVFKESGIRLQEVFAGARKLRLAAVGAIFILFPSLVFAGNVYWTAQAVTSCGQVSVASPGYAKQVVLHSILFGGNVLPSAGQYATVRIWDSPTGTTYTVAGSPAPVMDYQLVLDSSLSQTAQTRVPLVLDTTFHYGIVVDMGSDTVDSTYNTIYP
jgi:hypothetical protein